MPVDDPPAPTEPDRGDGDGDAGSEERPASAEPWRNTVPQAGPAPTTPAPPVRRFTLDNGLAVWLVESHRLPTVSASLVSRLGSAADLPDRPGLTDLTTGALDGGTTQRDALGLFRELEAAGATLGDDTGKDGTWLTATSLTGHAQAALAILADVVRNPTFPADEVERARDAAIVSLRQSRDDAAAIADTVTLREVYGAGHPYAHPQHRHRGRAAGGDHRRPAPGPRPDVHTHHHRPPPERRPDRSGSEKAGPRCLRHMDQRRHAVRRHQLARPGPPAGSPVRVLVVDKPDASQTALVLAAPGLARSDPDFELALVTNQVLGGGFSSRLNANLRETHGYTYGAYSDVDALRGIGLISISMAVESAVHRRRCSGSTLRGGDAGGVRGHAGRTDPGHAVPGRLGEDAVRHQQLNPLRAADPLSQ